MRWATVGGVLALIIALIAWGLWPTRPTYLTSGVVPATPLEQRDQLFVVRVGQKAGFIDRTGKVVIEPQFADAGPRFSEGLAPAARTDADGERWGYIDLNGKWIVEPRFRIAYQFTEGLALVREEYDSPHGFIDRTGAWILLPQFEAATTFGGGRALVGELTAIGKLKGRIDASEASDWRWRAIDRQGNDLGPEKVTGEWPFEDDGLRPIFPRGGGIGFEDRAGTVVIPPRFEETTGFSEGLAAVRLPGAEWGYIDRAGTWVVPAQFGWANPFTDGLAEVIVDRKSGYIDRTGAWVWKPSE